MGDEGATHLSKALETNSTLQSLDLRDNNIGDEGTTEIANVLSTGKNKTLQSLDLRTNLISDEGRQAIEKIIQSQPWSLKKLIIMDGNNFSVGMNKRLREAVLKNNALHEIDVAKDNTIKKKLQQNIQNSQRNANPTVTTADFDESPHAR